MTIFIPTTVLVETRNLDLTGNITFANLTDATLEAQRSIVGGTVIASGDIVFSQGTNGNCVSMNATRVFVELAENGIVGLLSNVEPGGTQCVGTQLGTAAVSTIDGSWSFRQRNITPPTQVCVKSPFGGIDSEAVTISN